MPKTTDRFRQTGPKTTDYKNLEEHIQRYYEACRDKKSDQMHRFLHKIRLSVLLHGCNSRDIVSEVVSQQRADKTMRSLFATAGHELPVLRSVEDTLRGKLWRTVLGCPKVSSVSYQKLVDKREAKRGVYTEIRKDTNRTFSKAELYKTRVSEERLVRVLNCYAQKSGKGYVQSMNCMAGVMLTVMPELAAFYLFEHILTVHLPLYFAKASDSSSDGRSGYIGAFAGSYLACAIFKCVDQPFYDRINDISSKLRVHPRLFFYPIIQSFQCMNQDFSEVMKLLDFLFCFGPWLCPLITVAHVLSLRTAMQESDDDDLKLKWLQQRSWMKGQLNANLVIKEAMRIIPMFKDSCPEYWNDLRIHTTSLSTAKKWTDERKVTDFIASVKCTPLMSSVV